MLHYEYDQELLSLEEKLDGQDMEFCLRVKRPDAGVEKAVKKIRDHFNDNDVITDVLFYAHHGEEYQWIVRHDYYVEFVLCLFKHRLLTAIQWSE